MLWQFVDAKQVKFAKDKDYLATGVDDKRGILKSIRHFIRQFIRHSTTLSVTPPLLKDKMTSTSTSRPNGQILSIDRIN